MDVQHSKLLAPFTTFHIGGPASSLIEVRTDKDVSAAVDYLRESGSSFFVLGAGSNVLVSDRGFDGVVLHMRIDDVAWHQTEDEATLIGGAGLLWEEVVDSACAQGLYGIENLAGIPGTLGGAAVQNIGAYGAELAPVFLYADVVDSTTGEARRITKEEAEFTYRGSFFKQHPELIIVRVALTLKKHGALNTSYADIVRFKESGMLLTTPAEVAALVRRVRAGKFPSVIEEGTAGSFFKNPVVKIADAAALVAKYPDLPTYPQSGGGVKVSLAWILDHVLSLKGYTKGSVRLYEKQPLVIVSRPGASSREVMELVHEVQALVYEATGIHIECEVEIVGE